MTEIEQHDGAVAEPVFKSAKRRKVLRKRINDTEDEAEESTAVVNDNAPSVSTRRRPLTRNQGVTVSSMPRAYATPLSSGHSEGAAVVPHITDVIEQVQNERFMKPTGKVGMVEDKHMVAYVDSKLAELRSSTIAAQRTGQQTKESYDTARGIEQLRNTPNRATVGDVEEVDIRSRNLGKGKPGLHGRQATSGKRSRRFPTRGEDDIVRDALVDQIMRESQVSLYDHSASAQPSSRGIHRADDSLDNDTAAAEAFKAHYFAQQEAQHRRRPPPPPAGKGATTTSSGPKLGGSRSQREKMKALEEANKGGVKKK